MGSVDCRNKYREHKSEQVTLENDVIGQNISKIYA